MDERREVNKNNWAAKAKNNEKKETTQSRDGSTPKSTHIKFFCLTIAEVTPRERPSKAVAQSESSAPALK